MSIEVSIEYLNGKYRFFTKSGDFRVFLDRSDVGLEDIFFTEGSKALVCLLHYVKELEDKLRMLESKTDAKSCGWLRMLEFDDEPQNPPYYTRWCEEK